MKKEITFGKTKIQKLNRVVIPEALLDNLNLSVGDSVELFYDIEREVIIIRRGKR